MDLNSSLLLLLVAGCGLGVGIVAWILAKAVTAMVGKTKGSLDDMLARALSGPLAAFAALVTAGVGLVLVEPRVDGAAFAQARRLLAVLFVVLAAWGLLRVLRVALERIGQRRPRFSAPARVGRRVAAVVLSTVAFLMILSVYGVSITPVLTGLGIAGLAVALALQDTGANFFAGIWIQTGRALQPGHYVKVEKDKGYEGYVEEVGWRVTRIRTLSGNTIVVPNNNLAQSIVTDFDLPTKDMSIVMEYRVGLESDPKRVIEVLVEEAKAAYKALPAAFVQDSPPFAQFSSLDDYSMKFSLILRVPEFVQQWSAQDAVHHRVVERLRKEGIRIPYPTRHNYQEAVKPEAKRVPGAPGGLAPHGRPKPRKRAEKPPQDPRLGEAEKAKEEIAAKQREKQEQEAKDQKGPPAPAPPPAEGTGGAAPAEAKASASGDLAPPAPEGTPKSEAAGDGGKGAGGEKPANPLTRKG